MQVHTKDSVKTIKVWYFANGTRPDFVKHQGYRYYTFDRKGNQLSGSCYDIKNKLVWENTYTYDSLNRMTKEIEYRPGEGKTTHEFTYDKEGATGEYHEGFVAAGATTEIVRDDDGNVIEEKTTYAPDDISISKYEYPKFDQKHNWTEMIRYSNGKPLRLYVRKLVYY